MRRFLLIFSVLCLILTLGCSAGPSDAPSATAIPESSPFEVILATGRPATPEPPAPTPEPTAPPEEVLRQIEELDRIDRHAAVLYINADRFLMHQFFLDPEANGASLTGPFLLEDSFQEFFTETAGSLLTDLHQLDREVLGGSGTTVYDSLDRFLSSSVTAFDNPYILDPLSDGGFLLSVPESLSLYRIENEEDVLFLSETIQAIPSWVNEAVSTENERISKGLSRSEKKLNALLAWCESILDEKGGAVLKAVKENINKADGLNRKQKKSYGDQISSLLKENLLPAAKTLKENVLIWKNAPSDASQDVSAESRENYEALLQWITQSESSPESMLELLESSAEDLTYTIVYYEPKKEDAFKGSRISNSISTLKRLTREMVDGVRDSRVKLVKVPDRQSGALDHTYILARPILDGNGEGQQLLYYSEEGRKEGLFPEIAKVYYPGEALIDALSFSSDTIGLFQKAYSYPCYRKGWACYAAEQAIIRQSAYDAEDSLYGYSRDLLFGEILPAIADVQIHYFGYDRKQLKEYLNQTGPLEFSEDYVDSLYEEAVDCPGKHIPAAYGYSFFCDLMKRMSSTLGERYLDSAVHAKLLGIGPCGLDTVRELMDEWADSQISG